MAFKQFTLHFISIFIILLIPTYICITKRKQRESFLIKNGSFIIKNESTVYLGILIFAFSIAFMEFIGESIRFYLPEN
tara:strand:+ start:106 stop:339 length:234 start_codon:yes stop_codon:yes gene_type:complete